MSIYKGATPITKVYKGGVEITKVYRGSTLIFENAPPPVDYGYNFSAAVNGTGKTLTTNPGQQTGNDFMILNDGLRSVNVVGGANAYQARIDKRTSSGTPFDLNSFPAAGTQGDGLDGTNFFSGGYSIFSEDGTKMYASGHDGAAFSGIRRYLFSGTPFEYTTPVTSKTDLQLGSSSINMCEISSDENMAIVVHDSDRIERMTSSTGFAGLTVADTLTAANLLTKIPSGDRLSGAALKAVEFNSIGKVMLALYSTSGASPTSRIFKFYTNTPFDILNLDYAAHYDIANQSGVSTNQLQGMRLMEDQDLLLIVSNNAVRSLVLTPIV